MATRFFQSTIGDPQWGIADFRLLIDDRPICCAPFSIDNRQSAIENRQCGGPAHDQTRCEGFFQPGGDELGGGVRF
jgi:hypothetical protein